MCSSWASTNKVCVRDGESVTGVSEVVCPAKHGPKHSVRRDHAMRANDDVKLVRWLRRPWGTRQLTVTVFSSPSPASDSRVDRASFGGDGLGAEALQSNHGPQDDGVPRKCWGTHHGLATTAFCHSHTVPTPAVSHRTSRDGGCLKVSTLHKHVCAVPQPHTLSECWSTVGRTQTSLRTTAWRSGGPFRPCQRARLAASRGRGTARAGSTWLLLFRL